MKINIFSNKKINRSLGGNMLLLLALTLFGLFMALPFIYAILQSLKPTQEIFAFPPRFFVSNPTLDNFYMLTQAIGDTWVPMGRYIVNSALVTVTATAGNCLFAAMAAFPLAKLHFRGNRLVSEIVTYALLFTAPVTQFPKYVIMAKTGFIDSYWALFLPPIAMPLGLFLLKNFMSQLPDSVLEAAEMDGASIYQTLWRVAIPNVKPALLTLIILTSQEVWNGAGASFIYSEPLKLLPTVLNQIAASGLARAGVGSAVAVVIMIVPVSVFILLQSKVIETMAFSGIKD